MFQISKSLIALFLAALLLAPACVVGPNFKKPAAPDVGGYTPTPISATAATESRRRRSAELGQREGHSG